MSITTTTMTTVVRRRYRARRMKFYRNQLILQTAIMIVNDNEDEAKSNMPKDKFPLECISERRIAGLCVRYASDAIRQSHVRQRVLLRSI